MSWPTSTEEPETQGPDAGRRGRRFEDIFILLCVLSLWPSILGLDHILYELLLYGALAGLIFVFVRRVRRFSQARKS